MKLCMGCMKNIEDHITQCPYCGYDESMLRQESYYLDPGTIIGGKYIVGRVIKYGGYTISYLGMDAEKNRKVMIKEYLPSDFSTRSDGEKEVTIYSGDAAEQYEQGLTAFLNEANRIQQLDHVTVIEKIYDCVAENDTGYVISEYVEGQTMNEVLDRGKVFSPAEAKDVISQILIGLNQVHPLNIIHCNISPETIMFTNDGEIKLLDFGATRYVTTANSKSLAILLKQGYAPEEQYRSRGERGPWTDVYALAAVMYRMITGNVPVESVDRALQDELKEPSRLGIEIPQNMENALMNALNVYQKDRTPSADVFLRELNSSQTARIQIKKRKNDTGRFPRWAKGLVAGLLCVVLAGGIYIAFNRTSNDGAANNELNKKETFACESMNFEKFKKYWEKDLELDMTNLDIVYEYDKDKTEEEVDHIIGKENSIKLINGSTLIADLKKAQKSKRLNGILYVKSNKRFSFKENWLKAYPNDKEAQMELKPDKNAKQKPYGTIKEIIYDGEKIYSDRAGKKTTLPTCVIGKELKFFIYTGDYYQCDEKMVKKICDKEYTNINQIKFDVYGLIYDKEEKKEKLRRKGKERPDRLVSDTKYYSFDKDAGFIVKIADSFKKVEKYDQRKIPESKLFDTVKERLEPNTHTVKELKDMLPDAKLCEGNGEREISGKNDWKIIGIKAGNKDCFKNGDTIHLELSTPTPEPTVEPIPEPTSAPTQTKRPAPTKTHNIEEYL